MSPCLCLLLFIELYEIILSFSFRSLLPGCACSLIRPSAAYLSLFGFRSVAQAGRWPPSLHLSSRYPETFLWPRKCRRSLTRGYFTLFKSHFKNPSEAANAPCLHSSDSFPPVSCCESPTAPQTHRNHLLNRNPALAIDFWVCIWDKSLITEIQCGGSFFSVPVATTSKCTQLWSMLTAGISVMELLE